VGSVLLPLVSREVFDDVAAAGPVVVFKHSSACWLSMAARRQVKRFATDRPDIPVYVLDVLEDVSLSREIERRCGIRHESPQVIVFRRGIPVWNASHRGVTARGLAEAVEGGVPDE
jgi:bacillithiol system protein YtxJ